MRSLLVVCAISMLVSSCGSTPDEPHVRPGQSPNGSEQKPDTIPQEEPIDSIADEPNDSLWCKLGKATFYDGWLLGVISFEARPPLDPSQNPWLVSVEKHRKLADTYRVCDLYRSPSPLATINSCTTRTYITIDSTGIAPSFSGFENAVFVEPFTIGGPAKIEHLDDGSTRITISPAYHNGYGRYGDTWAAAWPSIFIIPTETN